MTLRKRRKSFEEAGATVELKQFFSSAFNMADAFLRQPFSVVNAFKFLVLLISIVLS